MKISYRKFYLHDFFRLYRLLNHPLIIEQLPYQKPLSLFKFSMLCIRLVYEQLFSSDDHMIITADHRLIGIITLKRSLQPQNNSVSFELDPGYWGRGIMCKALQLFCKNLFKKYTDFEMYAYVREYNQRSINLLQKCGFSAIKKQNYYFNNQSIQIPVYEFKISHHE